ncbi:MAG: hypothetical protein WCA90_05330 [Ilumatobacteraceae bacterium]
MTGDPAVDASADAPRPRSGRRGAIDVARVGALVMVVIGHLGLAVIDRGPDGALRGANVLALHPGLAWLAMLAPMPVFFAAAGWANATATPRSAAPRLGRLVGLSAVVVVLWSVSSVGELLVRGGGGVVADGGRLATQPLWFLAVYVPFAALGSTIAGLAERPLLALGGCVAGLVVLDVVRFGFGAPELVGWPGFFLAWGVAWLLGAWWRLRWQTGWTHERRTGALLAVAGSAVACGLVIFAGYDPSLIDAVEGQRSNTTPPGLFTAVAGVVQVGFLMMIADWLDRVAARARGVFDRAGEASVAVYVWHLTSLALCAAVIAAGLWAPPRFSTGWWLTRPLWIAAVLGVTGLLAGATALGRRRSHDEIVPRSPSTARIAIGLVAATVGAGVVGLLGPRTLPSATLAAVAFLTGWWCLRTPNAPRNPS